CPDEIKTVSCEDQHDLEVFHTFELPEGDYPGESAVDEAAQDECITEFEQYVGTDYYESELRITVDLVLDSGRPVTQVSVDIGVNEGTLGNWVRKYRQEHPEQFAAEKPESVAYAEHQRVLKENAKLKQEVEFLSKVSAFFASKQQS